MATQMTPRDKQVARRNYVVFCGIATILMVLVVVAASLVIDG